MITEIIKNTIHYLETLVTDNNGDGVTGLTINYSVYKSSDDSLIASGTLIEIGNGIYKTSINISVVGQYRALYVTPSGYENEIEDLSVIEDNNTTQLIYLKRILGLSKENYRVFNPVYDAGSRLTSATIRIYDNALDYDADINSLGIYTFSASYDVNGNTITYGVKKVG